MEATWQERSDVTGLRDVMRWPVLTGGGWEGLGGRWGVRTKGPRTPSPPAPVSASAGRPHLEFIAAAAGKGRRGGRGDRGAEAAPLPAPLCSRSPAPGLSRARRAALAPAAAVPGTQTPKPLRPG